MSSIRRPLIHSHFRPAKKSASKKSRTVSSQSNVFTIHLIRLNLDVNKIIFIDIISFRTSNGSDRRPSSQKIGRDKPRPLYLIAALSHWFVRIGNNDELPILPSHRSATSKRPLTGLIEESMSSDSTRILYIPGGKGIAKGSRSHLPNPGFNSPVCETELSMP